MKRYDVGEKITGWPVHSWNRLADVEAQFGMWANMMAALPGRDAALPHALPISVKNMSGEDVVEFGVLGIDKPAFDVPDAPTDDKATGTIFNGVILECVEATEDDHYQDFVITLQPIKNNSVGWAAMAGITWARVNVSDTDHRYARVKDNQPDKLESDVAGPCRIIWKDSGENARWAVVAFRQQDSLAVGSTTSSILAANWGGTPPVLGSGNVQTYTRSGSDLISGPQETWYNGINAAISADRIVYAVDWAGVRLIVVESCSTIT